MSVREYSSCDLPALRAMLRAEGLGDDEMEFDTEETFVLDEGSIKGFFTLRDDAYGFPVLSHFCIDMDNRDSGTARRLAKAFKELILERGSLRAIVITKQDMKFVDKIVSRYFRTKPHNSKGGYNFYIVEVSK